ncbi:uncharacterized membrane protein YoaK (UPF0700 family) [Streptococcus loxodontisalivarius]|uniref:Uncharacterized membrane protein YoaK (UPF0700 family) n=2 Tax=Streptococcus loxodontisalivarius TaxID=1349415 RepID=A0ABS2PQE9_9STRE|nr:uncharacterized membrane protein YoaK (UPF0700 family) [Streptococcus loxodontisalivarius]
MRFGTLVATQTGNIVLLISDFNNHGLESSLLKCLSILFFSIGFLTGVFVKDRAKTAFWRIHNIIPLLIVSGILPFLPHISYLWVMLLAFSTGLLMITFTDSKIESHPYTILMTSGNYRKMLVSWYRLIGRQKQDPAMKRQAINYSITVVSFITGAIISASLIHLVSDMAIWFVTLCLILVIWHYINVTIRYHLQESNL